MRSFSIIQAFVGKPWQQGTDIPTLTKYSADRDKK